ncbi:uncharacterized protein LOC134815680 isoform X2 [Bolinopsis microptera]
MYLNSSVRSRSLDLAIIPLCIIITVTTSGKGLYTRIPDISRSHCVEQYIVTLHLLLSISSALYLYFDGIVETGEVVPRPKTIIIPACTELVTDANLETVFRSNCKDFETAKLEWIGVYSVPLDAPFKSSNPWPVIKRFFQKQFSVVDYHVFVVLHTKDGRYFAVEKQKYGVYVSFGGSLDSVIFYFKGAPRANPTRELKKAQSTSLLGDVVCHLKDILPTNCYSVWNKNCQHFAKNIFDIYAVNAKWDFISYTDVHLLFSRRGFPLIVLLLFVSCIYELYLLNTDNETQYAVYIVIPVSLYLLLSTNKNAIISIVRLLFGMLFLDMLLEGILYTPLGAIRKRGAQYSEMWRSGSWFDKCWLPLCYVMVYLLISIYLYLYWFLDVLLHMLSYLLGYLTTRRVPVLSPLLAVVTWLYDKVCKINLTRCIIPLYIATVIYFSLQD